MSFPSDNRVVRAFRAIGICGFLGVALFCVARSSNAQAAQHSVQIVVGGHPVPFMVAPYSDTDGQVWAPVDLVRLLGASFIQGDNNSLEITSASGKHIETTCRAVQDRQFVPIEQVASSLGAQTDWDAHTQTLTLRARLLLVREAHNSLTIATSYPVFYNVQSIDSPNRLFVDLYGVDLAASPVSVPGHGDNIVRIRSGKMGDNTVRLVLDLARPIHYILSSPLQTPVIQVALNTAQTKTAFVPVLTPTAPRSPQSISNAPDSAGIAPLPPVAVASKPQLAGAVPDASAGTATGLKITNIELQDADGALAKVVVTATGTAPTGNAGFKAFMLDNPNRLAFDLPGATMNLTGDLAANTDSSLPTDNPAIKAIRWGTMTASNESAGRIVLDLLQAVRYTVTSEPGDDADTTRYIITINPAVADNPPVAAADESNSNLAGKIVVVDAGHGGKDSGAPGIGGTYEKNFTLAISKELRDALTAAGATVIMTRSDDTFLPLTERAQIGIDHHADFFLCIHCDSSGYRNSLSGSTVYYHSDNSICHSLAQHISDRLGQLGIDIKADGVRSDYVRYPGIGFSVLRHSPEPAVLIECGYMNDANDVQALQDPETRKQIAAGIVAGVRDFVEDRVSQQ